jgi:hypothetical protein
VIKCIRRGLGFLSDDMTIITPDLQALCFPKPMTISAHTFHTAVEAGTTSLQNSTMDLKTSTQNTSPATVALSVGPKTGDVGLGAERSGRAMPIGDEHATEKDSGKGGLRIRSLVHSKSGRQFMRRLGNANVPIFTINTIGQAIVRPPKFKIEDIIKQDVKIVPKASIDAFYFLERGEGEEVVPIPKHSALQRAVDNSDDAFLFPPYKEVLQYLKVNGATAAELLSIERQRVEKLLEGISTNVIRSETRSWYKTVLARSVHGVDN